MKKDLTIATVKTNMNLLGLCISTDDCEKMIYADLKKLYKLSEKCLSVKEDIYKVLDEIREREK